MNAKCINWRMKRSMEKARVNYVDVAKIVGMFFIVLGHTLRGGKVTTWLYSFHVPLFFFLTGITFHYTEYKLKYFIIKKVKTLLIPFYVWSLISICIYGIVKNILPFDISSQLGAASPVLEILLGYCSLNSPLWFLPCLFVSELLMWIVLNLKQKLGAGVIIVSILISVLMCFLWPLINEKMVFWNIYNAIILSPFSLMGLWVGKKFKSIPFTTKGSIFSCFLLVVGGVVGTFVNHQIGYLGCYYGNPLLFYFSACLSIIGITYICKGFKKAPLITYFGRNTIHVLLTHKFVITFFMVCPLIKNYLTHENFFCVIISLATMSLCYFAGWFISKNKFLATILF